MKDPRSVVKPGDIVRVKVLDVDPKRRRISLTMRLGDPVEKGAGGRAEVRAEKGERDNRRRPAEQRRAAPAAGDGAMAEALRRAGLGQK